VLNGTVILQDDPSLVYGTWALVIATIIGIGITALLTRKALRHTQESNIITERMLELTHRPILKLDYVVLWWEIQSGNHKETYHVISTDSVTKELPVLIRFKLTNMGVESAQNIIVSYDVDFINNNDELIDLNVYKNKFTTNNSSKNTLHSKQFDLDLPTNHDEEYEINDTFEITPSTKCIITFEISYTFLGDSEGYIQYIYEYTKNGNNVLFRRHIS
jgi:hypothetical protein